MDGQELDNVLSIAAAAALLRVTQQTLVRWVACGAFDGAHTGIALSALLEILYRQPGHPRSFERTHALPIEAQQEVP